MTLPNITTTTTRITSLESLLNLITQPWFLVFALPLFGALLTVIVARFHKPVSQWISVITIGCSALLSAIFVFGNTWTENFIYFVNIYNSQTSSLEYLETSIRIDQLGALVALVAAGLGTLIALFSLEYMKGDEAETRYYFFLQVFVAGMVLLVLAGDLIFLYFGWKIVGVCSYFLIAHWYHKPDPQGSLCAKAGMKAFLMTLVGDLSMLLAFGFLWFFTGTINIAKIATMFATITNIPIDFKGVIAFCILLGAIGKSAQFPLITWLSSPGSVDVDAMQGPTTVSALIHAATMVKAGVYLMSRFYFVFGLASNWLEGFLIVFTIVAAITVFIAAASAMVATDIKRVLAYSTVSQLAYMFMGLAVAYLAMAVNEEAISAEGFVGAQFHLVTHACFKALLFLTAGALIHSLHHERDLRRMGGLKDEPGFKIPFIATWVGVLFLAGFPFITGSKEAVLGSAFALAEGGSNYAIWGWLLFIFGAIVAFMTAFYSFRFLFLIFYGKKPEQLHAEKPGPFMQGVLSVLIGLVVIVGLFGNFFLNEYFKPLFTTVPHELIPLLASNLLGPACVIILTAAGMALGYYIYYQGPRTAMPIIQKYRILNACHIIAREGFYLDAFYQGVQDLFMWLNWKLRKLQTGDLNYNMSLVGLVSLTIVMLLLIF